MKIVLHLKSESDPLETLPKNRKLSLVTSPSNMADVIKYNRSEISKKDFKPNLETKIVK